MLTLLVAVPHDLLRRLQTSLFWGASFRRVLALPEPVAIVAASHALCPDAVILTLDPLSDDERRGLLEDIRRHAVTHDVVIVAVHAGEAPSGVDLTVPATLDDGVVAPVLARLRALSVAR